MCKYLNELCIISDNYKIALFPEALSNSLALFVPPPSSSSVLSSLPISPFHFSFPLHINCILLFPSKEPPCPMDPLCFPDFYCYYMLFIITTMLYIVIPLLFMSEDLELRIADEKEHGAYVFLGLGYAT